MEVKGVFYHPQVIPATSMSASGLRPRFLILALKRLAKLDLVIGDNKQREEVISQVDPSRITFFYGELSTMPYFLADSDHLPRRPLGDFAFFWRLKRNKVKIGFFYRDVHWRFSFYYKKVGLFKGVVAWFFYHLEALILASVSSVIFLPSIEMRAFLPAVLRRHRCVELPPACSVRSGQTIRVKSQKEKDLHILYAGGLNKPIYDIEEPLKVLLGVERVRVTLCCRTDEIGSVGSLLNHPRLQVRHINSDDVDKMMDQVDLFFCYLGDHPYLSFAVPYKMMQAWSHGLPVITKSRTQAAKWVDQYQAGFTVGTSEKLVDVVNDCLKNPNLLKTLSENSLKAAKENSWSHRAKKIISILSE